MDATGDEDLADALAVKGYEFYQANDYHLGKLPFPLLL